MIHATSSSALKQTELPRHSCATRSKHNWQENGIGPFTDQALQHDRPADRDPQTALLCQAALHEAEQMRLQLKLSVALLSHSLKCVPSMTSRRDKAALCAAARTVAMQCRADVEDLKLQERHLAATLAAPLERQRSAPWRREYGWNRTAYAVVPVEPRRSEPLLKPLLKPLLLSIRPGADRAPAPTRAPRTSSASNLLFGSQRLTTGSSPRELAVKALTPTQQFLPSMLTSPRPEERYGVPRLVRPATASAMRLLLREPPSMPPSESPSMPPSMPPSEPPRLGSRPISSGSSIGSSSGSLASRLTAAATLLAAQHLYGTEASMQPPPPSTDEDDDHGGAESTHEVADCRLRMRNGSSRARTGSMQGSPSRGGVYDGPTGCRYNPQPGELGERRPPLGLREKDLRQAARARALKLKVREWKRGKLEMTFLAQRNAPKAGKKEASAPAKANMAAVAMAAQEKVAHPGKARTDKAAEPREAAKDEA